MTIEEDVFAYKVKNEDKLKQAGFLKTARGYEKTYDLTNDFYAVITIDEQVHGHVYDRDTKEEYALVHVAHTSGFSAMIREDYRQLLETIAKTCFEEAMFDSPQANRLAKWTFDTYGIKPDEPFQKVSGHVFRNEDGKWFGLIMRMNTKVLDGQDRLCEVLNVKKTQEGIGYPAYHMNKKTWISIILDDSYSDEVIAALMQKSYETLSPRKAWLLPANSTYFDVEAYFDHATRVAWHARNKMKKGDQVFVYLSAPYSCLLYHCQVVSIGEEMILEKVEKYKRGEWSLEVLKSYGVKAVRSARSVPDALLKVLI